MNQFPQAQFGSPVEKLRVVRFVVIETGTYNPMYYRPYVTSFTPDTAEDLAVRIDSQGPTKVTSGLMAGIANRIIMPSMQQVGVVPIANGWDTKRGRFNMVIEETSRSGAVCEYHIQGFTEHYDLSFSGQVDPNMEFYVNSFTRISKSYINTATGLVQHDTVMSSAQVINGRMVYSQLGGLDLIGMRPTDIFSTMQGGVIRNPAIPDHYREGLQDDRHVFSHQAVQSSRSNNMPANILSRIVDSYNTGLQMEHFGVGSADVYSRSKGYVYENSLQENPFFRRISNIRGIPDSTSFSLNNLLTIDPNCMSGDVAKFMRLGQAGLARVHQIGQSEVWHRGDDTLAWVCTSMMNAMSTIMMELMLSKIAFKANNYDTMGQTSVVFGGARDTLGRDDPRIVDVFKHRFGHEVMFDITRQNQITYACEVHVDLFGESSINISYDGSPFITYTIPSFCDAQFAPVLTTDVNNLYSVAHDFESILRSVHGTMRPEHVADGI